MSDSSSRIPIVHRRRVADHAPPVPRSIEALAEAIRINHQRISVIKIGVLGVLLQNIFFMALFFVSILGTERDIPAIPVLALVSIVTALDGGALVFYAYTWFRTERTIQADH